jgi:hypothetical protein
MYVNVCMYTYEISYRGMELDYLHTYDDLGMEYHTRKEICF